MQEEFEEWAKQHRVDVSRDNRTGAGYWYDQAQLLWQCWLAAQQSVHGTGATVTQNELHCPQCKAIIDVQIAQTPRP